MSETTYIATKCVCNELGQSACTAHGIPDLQALQEWSDDKKELRRLRALVEIYKPVAAEKDGCEVAMQEAIKLIAGGGDPPNECIAALGVLMRALPLDKQPDLGD